MKPTRFAPLIRVSTESQEQKGESLKTQETQIRSYVKALDGIIIDDFSKYCGQEHGTENYDREKLDLLLSDAARDVYDAVIVCDASRWSRDNVKSEKGLEILRNNGKLFYIGSSGYDLFNPEHLLFINLSTVIGQFQAKQQKKKSVENRIERAKKNIPSAGQLPFGRDYDRKTDTWRVDPEKQKLLQRVGQRYLAGESMQVIAASVNLNYSSLWKNLSKTSGDTWPIKFHCPDLNISETVNVRVPALLPPETIAAIHARAEGNKTYTHGKIKNRYLLSRMVFCSRCGRPLFGETNHRGKRYYRHATRFRSPECDRVKLIPAAELENSVLIELTQVFGDVERVRAAIARATPDKNEMETLTQESRQYQTTLDQLETKQDNVIAMVADGTLDKAEVQKHMEQIRSTRQTITASLDRCRDQLQGYPDKTKVEKYSLFGVKVMANMTKSPKYILKAPYKNQRALVEHAFAGKDSQGQRLGVYIDHIGDKDQPLAVEIRGALESTVLGLPLSDDYLETAFKLDSDYQDVAKELEHIRSNVINYARHWPQGNHPD